MSDESPQFVLASRSPRRIALLRAAGYRFRAVTPPLSEPPSRSQPRAAVPQSGPAQLAEALAYFKARSVQAIFPDELILGADTVVALGGRVYGKADDVEAARTMLRALSGQRQEVITGVAVLLPAEDRHGQDARATHGRDAHAMPPGHGQDARATHGRDAHATRQNAHDSPHSRGRLCHNGRDAHATGEDAHAPERRLLAHEVTYVTMRAMSEAEIQQYLDSGEWRDKAGAYAIQETADRFVQSVEGSLTNVVGLPMELVARLLRQARTGRRNDR